MTPPPLPFRLLAIGDRGQITAATAREVAEAGGGAVALLLRDRTLDHGEVAAWARTVVAVCRVAGAWVLVHGWADVARDAGADGVHLPEGGSIEHAQAVGPHALVGVSRHGAAGVAQAWEAGASYATLGPVFPSPGKGTPLGLDAFAAVARATPLPLVALGGVRPEHCVACRAAGAAAVAAIGAVWDGAPGENVRRLLAAFAPQSVAGPTSTGG